MPVLTRTISDVNVNAIRNKHAPFLPASPRGEQLLGFQLPLVLREVVVEGELHLLANRQWRKD
jgi:hypothetical protein